jgi:hypothetical protein
MEPTLCAGLPMRQLDGKVCCFADDRSTGLELWKVCSVAVEANGKRRCVQSLGELCEQVTTDRFTKLTVSAEQQHTNVS